ncbi:MAG: hypothetical protein FE78DRAFT_304826 [Acidomyces sp. 'richmondensis']|nr:MAG: hypothetical protein FE78DRAFT_304826 [Acidomyces sp. 'richmondensis']
MTCAFETTRSEFITLRKKISKQRELLQTQKARKNRKRNAFKGQVCVHYTGSPSNCEGSRRPRRENAVRGNTCLQLMQNSMRSWNRYSRLYLAILRVTVSCLRPRGRSKDG